MVIVRPKQSGRGLELLATYVQPRKVKARLSFWVQLRL